MESVSMSELDYSPEGINSILDLAVVIKNEIVVVDSRLVAEGLGIQHKNLLATISSYTKELERRTPLMRETEGTNSKGRPEVFYWLTKLQSNYLVTLSRNTPQVAEFKWALAERIEDLETQLIEARAALAKQRAINEATKSLVFLMLKKAAGDRPISDLIIEREQEHQATHRDLGTLNKYLAANPDRDFDSPDFDLQKFVDSCF